MREGRFIQHLLCVVALTAACGGETVDGMPTNPTAEDIQALIFDETCSQGGCHDLQGAGGLVLTDAQTSKEQLVGHESENETARNSGILRVVAGEPDESFLIRKITVPTLGEGLPMPIEMQLSQPYVDLVVRWIEQGAP